MHDPFDAGTGKGDLVLFDLEFTAWEGSMERAWSEPWEHREIIQIGAVRLKDDTGFSEVSRMLCYVSPTKNPQLSDYITALTGIDQKTVDDEGFDFPEALDIFVDFCDGARAVISYSGDPDVMAENCALNGIKPPKALPFVELDAILARRAGPEFAKTTSYRLPELVGLPLEGQAHDALDDCLAIAATLRALRERGTL